METFDDVQRAHAKRRAQIKAWQEGRVAEVEQTLTGSGRRTVSVPGEVFDAIEPDVDVDEFFDDEDVVEPLEPVELQAEEPAQEPDSEPVDEVEEEVEPQDEGSEDEDGDDEEEEDDQLLEEGDDGIDSSDNE